MVAIVKTLLRWRKLAEDSPRPRSQIHPRISAVQLLTFEPARSIRVIDAIKLLPFAKTK